MKNRLVVNAAHVQEKGTHLDGELSSTTFDLVDSERIRCNLPLEYDLRISFVQQSLLIVGAVRTVLDCRCDRCLTEFRYAINNPEVCHYIEIPNDRIIDLTERIREDILILFPQKCLCHPSCKGLCPKCGQCLNLKQCACSSDCRTSEIWQHLDELIL